jgi:hypothetical protein
VKTGVVEGGPPATISCVAAPGITVMALVVPEASVVDVPRTTELVVATSV